MTTTPYLKPLPEISEENRPFWDALRSHEFVVPQCQGCGSYSWPPYPACRACLSEELKWTRVLGDAEVFSYTIVHHGQGQFDDDVPFAIVMAQLKEPCGCLVLGNTRGIAIEDLYVGLPIKIVYEDIPDEDVTLYRFGPR